ncbi:hypothetical protein CIB48_g11856 [Xylaria polymorpha]|nr:hypothetical protein CIB48_g11856 [Xylaria polymorpha]
MAKREDVHEELPRYVPQDPCANTQCNPSPTHFLPEDLIGTVLGQRFEVRERLHDENKNNHFITFTVHQHGVNFKDSTDDTGRLVARIYDMNNLTTKHKRYKIRSINRSAARTVFKTTWNLCQIIILRLELSGDPQSSIDIETARFGNSSPKPKTNNEDNPPSLGTRSGRESSRLRQLDRRAAKRCQKRSIANSIRTGLDLQPRPLSETLALKESNHGIDDITFAMLVMLHYAFNPRPELKAQLPPANRAQITWFLDGRSAKVVFSNDDEKREFMQIKEIELVGMRRLAKKLTGVTQQCHDELHGLLQEQALTTRGSAQWNHLQENFIITRRNWYMVLVSASKVLPKLVTESEELVNLLRSELREASELKEKRRILNHKQWIRHLIPGSETYNELFRALQNGRVASIYSQPQQPHGSHGLQEGSTDPLLYGPNFVQALLSSPSSAELCLVALTLAVAVAVAVAVAIALLVYNIYSKYAGESGVLNIRSLSNDHHLELDRSDEDFSEWFDYDKYYYASEQGTLDKTSVGFDGLSDTSPAVADCEALYESLDGYSSPQQLLDPAAASRPLFSTPLFTRDDTPDHVLSFSSPSSSQHSSAQPSHRPVSGHASSSPSASTSSQTSTSFSNAHSCSICNEPQLDVEQWM